MPPPRDVPVLELMVESMILVLAPVMLKMPPPTCPLQKFLFKSLNEGFTSGIVMSIVLARLPHLSTIQLNFEFDPLVKLHKMKG